MQTNLINNGLDFIIRAANDLVNTGLSEEQRVKYSTIELYEGIELLLKARLAKEHWSLVVRDIDKYKHDSFQDGSFISVNFDALCERLSSVCKFDLEQRAKESFNKLRKVRNCYVHFACKQSYASVIATQVNAWHYILTMIENGFLGDLTVAQEDILNEAKHLMIHSDEYLNTRFTGVRTQIDKASSEGRFVANCPTCGKPALLIDDVYPSCPVCGTNNIDPKDVADDYAAINNSSWKFPNNQIEYCENCDSHAVVPIGDDLKDQVNKKLLKNNKRELFEGKCIKICFCCGNLIFQ